MNLAITVLGIHLLTITTETSAEEWRGDCTTYAVGFAPDLTDATDEQRERA